MYLHKGYTYHAMFIFSNTLCNRASNGFISSNEVSLMPSWEMGQDHYAPVTEGETEAQISKMSKSVEGLGTEPRIPHS